MAIAELGPDLVLLSTPHGVADLSQFMFYLNPEVLTDTVSNSHALPLPSPSPSLPSLQGFGWADTDNCVCPPCCYNVSVAMDANKSLELVHKLQVTMA